MGSLEGFESKDFIEQVAILGALDPERDRDAIPHIIALLGRIPGHEAIVLVMRDTLKRLFSASEAATVSHLASDDRDIRKICIEVAAGRRFASAAAVLDPMARRAFECKDHRLLFEALGALARIAPADFIDLFRGYVDHEDPLVSSLCIETLGSLNDAPTFERMRAIVRGAQADSFNGLCDLPTASAVMALGRFQGRDAVEFFISLLHHGNPGVRRVIHHELARKGADAVEALGAVFRGESVDAKIFAANILGLIGTREAAGVLVQAMDTNRDAHPNIRYAVYEALGSTPGMAGLVCLADGLAETDGMVLLAVVSSLGVHLNQWILDRITEMIGKGTEHGKMLVRTVIASGAMNIFEGLYRTGDAVATMLIDEIRGSGVGEHVARYAESLAGMDLPRAKADLQILEGLAVQGGGLHVLAVDDSKTMLNFYRSVVASLGMNITTAVNGREALDIIAEGKRFDLIITDMNMPVMDGVEFTRHVRGDRAFAGTPIIMITTESERSQEDLARKAGVTHFMQKPFGAEKLQETITACL